MLTRGASRMNFIRTYTYPTFIAVSSTGAVIADVLQNDVAFTLVTTTLGLAGIVFLAAPARLLARTGLTSLTPSDPSGRPATRSFGASCLLLAALVFGFATLSSRAADDGGVIASGYPEIRDIQVSIGVIQSDLHTLSERSRRIQQMTERMNSFSVQSLSLNFSAADYGDNARNVGFGVDNPTGNIFDDIEVTLNTSDGTVRKIFPTLGPSDSDRQYWPVERLPARITLCVNAKPRGLDEYITERREYVLRSGSHAYTEPYELTATTGAVPVSERSQCT